MLSIVLVNWNGWGDTLSCIQSILNASSAPFRIIIVDNMSTDDSLEAFEKWGNGTLNPTRGNGPKAHLAHDGRDRPRRLQIGRYIEVRDEFTGFSLPVSGDDPASADVYVVHSGRNGGFGFGCNLGMRLADVFGTDGYWLLNNDCVIDSSALVAVSESVTKRPDSVFGTIVRYYDPPHAIQAVGGGHLSLWSGKSRMFTGFPMPAPLNYIYGASVAFSRQLREKVGDFDQRIFMYYEEMDYCIRISRAGFSFDVVETEVFHRHGASQGGVSASAWKNVLSNKWYVLNKHVGPSFWLVPFWSALIVRCLNPFGNANARIGARRAFIELTTKAAR